MSYTQKWKCFMDVLLEKSPFCTELTQILNLKETETHYGKSLKRRHIHSTSNEGIWPQKFSNSMHGIKSAKLAISKVALLTPCMEFEFFCGKIPSFEVL